MSWQKLYTCMGLSEEDLDLIPFPATVSKGAISENHRPIHLAVGDSSGPSPSGGRFGGGRVGGLRIPMCT
jgi:hypothetical protein